jgi:hypothetical protein
LEPLAIITRDEVISRILSHLRLPSVPAPLGPAGSLAYEVTGEPMDDWVLGGAHHIQFQNQYFSNMTLPACQESPGACIFTAGRGSA